MEETSENTNHTEEAKNAEPGRDDQINWEVITPFDSALGNHFERLLGTRMGIETLPLDLFTVPCLVLLAARETEIESFPYLPPERYNHERLLEEMSDISIQSGEDLESGIQSMIEKGYIEVADDGRFFAKEPTISMANLIDRIFPTMPGLNLVAYLGQMIDEAIAGRKDIEVAVSQFNQMLEMHGIPINKEPEQRGSKTKLYPHLKVGVTPPKTKVKKILTAGIRPANIFSKLQTKVYISNPAEPDTLTSESDTDQNVIANNVFESELQEKEPQCEKDSSFHEEEKVRENEIPTESEEEKDLMHEQMEQETNALKSTGEPQLNQEEKKPEIPSEQRDFSHDDDDVEKKIAAFEEQLGMTCPLCRDSEIRTNKTAKGKLYYHCTNTNCNFISWGKPYYIACPKCSNPFLIEASNSMKKTILKCPRATCHHWQKFPWDEPDEISEELNESVKAADVDKKPRRKVKRRRRVVRRKR